MAHPHRARSGRSIAFSAGAATLLAGLTGCSLFSGAAGDAANEPPLADLPSPAKGDGAWEEGFFDPFATSVQGDALTNRATDTPGAVLESVADAEQTGDESPKKQAETDTEPQETIAATNAGARPGAVGVYGQVGADDSKRRTRAGRGGPGPGGENLMLISYGAHGADFDPDVSRDGKRIVFASTQHRPTADIYSKRVGARSITQLTSDPANDVMPSFSPTGERVAFSSDRAGSWDLYVMNRSGGQAVQLTGSDAHELHPSWSPDGSMLAYCRLGPVSGRWELWVMDTENPAVRHFIGYGLFPEWNPVGNKILFQRARERGDRLFSVWTLDFENGEGRNPTEVISSPSAAIVNPTWSPDGARIAFATITSPAHVYGDRPDSADLWIVDSDGSNRANLTGGSFVNLMPTWGRDNRIYFVSDRSGRDSIWSVLPERAIIAAGGRPTQNLANVPDEDDN